MKFNHSTFGENANFELTRFLKGAVFQNVRFEGKVSFTCAKFPNLAFFSHSQFGGVTAPEPFFQYRLTLITSFLVLIWFSIKQNSIVVLEQ
ncbi:MAG: hypothetical protein GZ093_19090 [Rhodoferax sp.]|nr:hypothetical protein [Rhodoferax sp.]